MISKRSAIIGAIIIVLLTTALNVTVGNVIAIRLGQKVVVSEDTYEYYNEMKNKYGKLFSLNDYLMKNYYQELDEEELIEGAIKGMFDSIGDPYTNYMSLKEFKELMTRTSGSYGGIGVIVTPGDDGFVTVVSPIEDTPGERAGLRTGDRIVTVDDVTISGDKLEYAVELMKGKPGTTVNLAIRRDGVSNLINVSIVREEIRLKTVKSEVIDGNIGYIRITMFDEKTADDFKEQLNELEKSNIEALILDLRNNPGGLLSQCIKIADMLLGEQLIVYTEDRHGVREEEKSKKQSINYPLVMLVNGGSASASEILAGAIKDGEAGTIIGTTTFGKALVQQVKPLNDGTGFKYTIAQYFTPNGTNIHGTGIEPHIVVELPEELEEEYNLEKSEDLQLIKALEVIKEKIK
ncbi:S41 family peptidase [Alkaliphilus peptidifermentans]|uniref:C-terminal processing peptidase-3. Serine peptidase. MEROPS family S41A n=1 Tax=Alkaliphilus peptidifermentans DSM 18978 TaxID=1120976 RepID=A0A1G5G9W4_9FIRM|nr:S41 family peptidase [Alkaliphilus peptidifermentans]SCY48426.1 C-terminal processing peptidase-3. Serine peptidase. MEROPS family S41A [Alkaliphilus peptidifermentans DSM 18978]